MRIVHTADLHLDTCYAESGLPAAVGNRLRQSARDVFHRIVLRAGDWPADALLIAGDLFEADRVTRETVSFILSELQSIAHVPVFVAPGKFDPFSDGSPYATENWPRNVTIFRAPDWTRIPLRGGRLVVHGLGYSGDPIPRAPFRDFALRETHADGAHVAVSYGWDKLPGRKAATNVLDAVAYIALGGIHHAEDEPDSVLPQAHYSGTPQALGFDGVRGHHFIEAEILAGKAHVRRVPSSRVAFVAMEVECSTMNSIEAIAASVRARLAAEALPVVLRLTLSGRCAISLRGMLGTIQDALANDVQHVDIIDQTECDLDFAALAQEDSSLGAYIRTLNEEIKDCTEEQRKGLLLRAREVGIAGFSSEPFEIKGLEVV